MLKACYNRAIEGFWKEIECIQFQDLNIQRMSHSFSKYIKDFLYLSVDKL